MCGIFAFKGVLTQSQLKKIKEILALRGPDQLGYEFIDDKTPLHLINSRLSLVGDLIFPLQQNNMLLLANGEFYNYKEVTRLNFNDFNNKPVTNDFFAFLLTYQKFKQHMQSDKAFVQLFKYFFGDFALLLFDFSDQSLFYARDQFGIRPLWYFYLSADNWGFASEKNLLMIAGIEKDLISQIHPGTWGRLTLQSKPFQETTNIDWYYLPEYIFKRPAPPPRDLTVDIQKAISKIESYLIESIDFLFQNLPLSKHPVVGIFFSGGLDSTLLVHLANQLHKEFVTLTLGIQGSSDVATVDQILSELNKTNQINHYFVIISPEEIEKELKVMIKRLENRSPVQVSIALSTYFLTKFAKKLNLKVCISGQGADELFGGYKRYEDEFLKSSLNPDQTLLSKMLYQDLKTIAENNIERDDLVAATHGIELRFPYLYPKLVDFVLRLPIKYLITNNPLERKLVLRLVAKKLNLPQMSSSRKKVAVQYGTGIQKVIKKLAKQERLTLSQYLATL